MGKHWFYPHVQHVALIAIHRKIPSNSEHPERVYPFLKLFFQVVFNTKKGGWDRISWEKWDQYSWPTVLVFASSLACFIGKMVINHMIRLHYATVVAQNYGIPFETHKWQVSLRIWEHPVFEFIIFSHYLYHQQQQICILKAKKWL